MCGNVTWLEFALGLVNMHHISASNNYHVVMVCRSLFTSNNYQIVKVCVSLFTSTLWTLDSDILCSPIFIYMPVTTLCECRGNDGSSVTTLPIKHAGSSVQMYLSHYFLLQRENKVGLLAHTLGSSPPPPTWSLLLLSHGHATYCWWLLAKVLCLQQSCLKVAWCRRELQLISVWELSCEQSRSVCGGF
jgi:hypothetical protein